MNIYIFIIPYLIDVSGDRFVQSGSWDSIHVVEAVETGSKANTTTYKLTTTIMLHISIDKVELGKTMLSGSLTRQVTISSYSSPLLKLSSSPYYYHNHYFCYLSKVYVFYY